MYLSIAKRADIFILVVFLSFSAVLAVNAEAREKVFDWIIEEFPKFSVFISEDIDQDKVSDELTSFTINYIPEGFELVDINEGRKMLIISQLLHIGLVLLIWMTLTLHSKKKHWCMRLGIA